MASVLACYGFGACVLWLRVLAGASWMAALFIHIQLLEFTYIFSADLWLHLYALRYLKYVTVAAILLALGTHITVRTRSEWLLRGMDLRGFVCDVENAVLGV